MEEKDLDKATDRRSERKQKRRKSLLEWLVVIAALVAFFVADVMMYGVFYLIYDGDVPTRGNAASFCFLAGAVAAYLVLKLLPKRLFKEKAD